MSPHQSRRKVRLELNWFDELAAAMFAMAIFLGDGLRAVGSLADSISAEFRETAFKALAGEFV